MDGQKDKPGGIFILGYHLNSALVQEAKQLEINLSREFEILLAQLVKRRKQEKWLLENREALDAYNAHVERDGVFSDGLRSFYRRIQPGRVDK